MYTLTYLFGTWLSVERHWREVLLPWRQDTEPSWNRVELPRSCCSWPSGRGQCGGLYGNRVGPSYPSFCSELAVNGRGG